MKRKYSSVFSNVWRLKHLLEHEIAGLKCVICLNRGIVGLAITNRGPISHRQLCEVIGVVGIKLIREIKKDYPDFYLRYVKSSYEKFYG